MQPAVALSPARREFLLGLYQEFQQRTAADVDKRRELYAGREQARPAIRALADELAARNIDLQEFRSRSEKIARQYPYYGFMGLNGQMFVNQLAYAGRDASMDDEVAQTLGDALRMPSGLQAAKEAIDRVVAVVERLKDRVTKYGALGAWRVPYLVPYFWEAGDVEEYPIMYPSVWRAVELLGLVGRWPAGGRRRLRADHPDLARTPGGVRGVDLGCRKVP